MTRRAAAATPVPTMLQRSPRGSSCGCHATGGSCARCGTRTESGNDSVDGIARALEHSPSKPLDASLRARFGAGLGHDFSRVRVHADAAAARAADAVDARAFTLGEHVVFGSGEFAPHTPAGERLLAHELVHVAQQERAAAPGGRARIGAADSPAEREAERAAGALVSGRAAGLAGAAVAAERPESAGTLLRQPKAPAAKPWVAADAISVGILNKLTGCGVGQDTRGRADKPNLPPFAKTCGSVCARKPLPLSLLYHVDSTPPGPARPGAADVEPPLLFALVLYTRQGQTQSTDVLNAIGPGKYDQPGHSLIPSFNRDLSGFTPPAAGELSVKIAIDDAASGEIAVYTDTIPITDCPDAPPAQKPPAARKKPAPMGGVVHTNRWLVVLDPINAPLDYRPLGPNEHWNEPGAVVEILIDDKGSFYTFGGRRIDLPRER